LHSSLTCRAFYLASAGFTLIELITVVLIVAVLMMVGVPVMMDFVAEQRVRTVSTDIAREIAFARATAIEQSRRVYFEKTSVLWNNGWRIYADINGNASYDAGEEIRIFEGLPATSRAYVCTNVADFATNIVFRPDGRVVRTGAPGVNDGLFVIDTMGDDDICNNKVRSLYFGLSGRVTVQVLKSATPGCPGIAPPCVKN
jgi:prepilin-type N-terminal cleavage/methylation domain-containing protein